MNPTELQHDDHASIDTEPLAGTLWRVSDVEVQDIGIATTFAVTLVSDSEQWSLIGTTEGETCTASPVESDDEYDVRFDSIELS
jgi:hypothetical protein